MFLGVGRTGNLFGAFSRQSRVASRQELGGGSSDGVSGIFGPTSGLPVAGDHSRYNNGKLFFSIFFFYLMLNFAGILAYCYIVTSSEGTT